MTSSRSTGPETGTHGTVWGKLMLNATAPGVTWRPGKMWGWRWKPGISLARLMWEKMIAPKWRADEISAGLGKKIGRSARKLDEKRQPTNQIGSLPLPANVRKESCQSFPRRWTQLFLLHSAFDKGASKPFILLIERRRRRMKKVPGTLQPTAEFWWHQLLMMTSSVFMSTGVKLSQKKKNHEQILHEASKQVRSFDDDVLACELVKQTGCC